MNAISPSLSPNVGSHFRYNCVWHSYWYFDAAHSDLGLLSLVHGDQPGLEVWDRYSQDFFPLERSYTTPKATLLVGAQLARLTNIRYVPGGHQVRSYCETDASSPQCRYKLVSFFPLGTDNLSQIDTLSSSFNEPIGLLKLIRMVCAA